MSETISETLACTLDGKCSTAYHGDSGEPADSHRLKIGEDIDWIDVSSVYERDDSLKETTNPKSHTYHAHSSQNTGSNSQRFSGNLKPSIIGLPGKIQNPGYSGHSARRQANMRIFPKKVKTGGGGKKQAVPEFEPGSPKISCMGKVLSQRERGKRRQRLLEKLPKEKTPVKKEKISCWVTVAAIFCNRHKKAPKMERKREDSNINSNSNSNSISNIDALKEMNSFESVDGTLGIGGMKRFTSGRKVDWDFQVTDEGNR